MKHNSCATIVNILPSENSIAALIECIRAANEELIHVASNSPGGRVKVSNEIAYADENGEMQFLRRTLLSGAYKFDRRITQVLPKKLLDHFRSSINFVSTLICAGYGFDDNHINEVIRGWLEFAPSRKLVIVDPFRKAIPPPFLHLSLQIELHQSTFTDFLDQTAGIARCRREKLEKELAAWARKNQFDSNKRQDFAQFVQDSMDARLLEQWYAENDPAFKAILKTQLEREALMS